MAVGIQLADAQRVIGQDPDALKELKLEDGKVESGKPLKADEMFVSGQTINIADQVGIDDGGSVLSYTLNRNPGKYRTLAFTEFDDTGTVTQEPRTYSLTTKAKIDLQGDSSTELTAAAKFTSTISLTTSLFGLHKAYLFFGATVPDAITISAYSGTEAIENRLITATVDTSTATPSAEFEITGLPIIGFYDDEDLVLTVESATSFTLHGNSGGDFYSAVDGSEVTFVDLLDENDYAQRQTIRTGVKGNYSIAAINGNTQIEITADDASGFTELFFNDNLAPDNDDGFTYQMPDQIIDVIDTPNAARYYVSIDRNGAILQSPTKVNIGDILRIRLIAYSAKNGILEPTALSNSPVDTWSDRALLGVLEDNKREVKNLDIDSQDNGTMGLSNSAYSVVDVGINYAGNKVDPHSLPVIGSAVTNWTYSLQTLDIVPTVGVDVLIDPDKWDNAGVEDDVSYGKASIQAVYSAPGPQFVILRGQEELDNYTDAVENMWAVDFILPIQGSEWREVARIAVKEGATDSADFDNQCSIEMVGTGAGGAVAAGGDVTGPATSVPNEIPVYLGTEGKAISNTSKVSVIDGKFNTLSPVVNFELQKKIGVSVTEQPKGVIQANDKSKDTTSFSKDVDCPIVGNMSITNGGDTPADPDPALILMRPGVSSQAFGNILRVDLSRYENSGTNARTQADIKLSHGSGTSEANNTPLVMSLKSDGTATFKGYEITPTAIQTTVDDQTLRLKTRGDDSIIELESPTETEVYVTSNTDTYAGVNFVVDGTTLKGGVGFREGQLVLQPDNFQTDEDSRGVIVDQPGNQTRVEGIKHYRDGGFYDGADVIEASPDSHLYVKPASGKRLYFSENIRAGYGESIVVTSHNIAATSPSMQFNGPSAIQTPALNQEQMDAAVTNTPLDYGKIAFNAAAKDLEYHDGEKWIGLKQNGNHRSLHLVIGDDTTGPSHTPGVDILKGVINDLPIHTYKVDGENGNPADYDQSLGRYILPAGAPEGYYQMNMRGRATLQGFDRSTVSNTSQWLVWMSINNGDPRFAGGGDPDTPVSDVTVFTASFSDSTVKYLTPLDTLAFFYNILYNNSNSSSWYLDELRFEISYLGK